MLHARLNEETWISGDPYVGNSGSGDLSGDVGGAGNGGNSGTKEFVVVTAQEVAAAAQASGPCTCDSLV